MPVQDVSDEELEEMGFKGFRVTKEGYIHPNDVEAFLEYDRRPLTEKEKEYLRMCREKYDKNPIQSSNTSAKEAE